MADKADKQPDPAAAAPAGNISLEGYSAEQIRDLAALAIVVNKNPETAREFQRLAKKAVPSAHFPELDLDDRISAASKANEDKIEKLQNELKERDARSKWDEHRMAPVKAGIIEEAGLADLETYMKEKGFNATQYLQAARYRQMEGQLATPTAPETLVPSGFSANTMAELRKDPEKWVRENGLQAVREAQARMSRQH